MITAFARAALALTVLLATGCSFYLGEPRVPKTDFRAALNGSNEVPPTQSRGSGYFEAVYRPSTKVLEYRLNLVGLSGPITMGYLHGPAGPGENADKVAPINIPIYYYNSGIWDGVTLTEQQAAEVLAGRWYVNVMTLQYPDGEIRGQILPTKTSP
jgi:CHRD domain-containing protein